jgi:hypothetical protein
LFDWIEKVDVRGSGGFVFAPPSQFKGNHSYCTIWTNVAKVNSSEKFKEMLK